MEKLCQNIVNLQYEEIFRWKILLVSVFYMYMNDSYVIYTSRKLRQYQHYMEQRNFTGDSVPFLAIGPVFAEI